MKKVFLFLGLVLSVTLFMQCRKDAASVYPKVTVQEAKVDLNKAKAWFEANKVGTLKCEPNWTEAKQIDIGLGAMEVPILINGAVVIPSLSKGENAKKGAMRLLIQNDEDKNIIGSLIEYAPSEKFTDAIETINWATAGTSQFDGMIFLKSLDGRYLGGIALKEGKVLSKNVKEENNSTHLRLLICEPTYYRQCVSMGPYSDCQWLEGPPHCYSVGGGGAGEGGVFNGGGSSGGGGGTSGGSSGGAVQNSNDIHCSSFSFSPIGVINNINYQEAIVSGIKIISKDIDGNIKSQSFTISYFIPTLDALGSYHSPQDAIYAATEATNLSIAATENFFFGAHSPPAVVGAYFSNDLSLRLIDRIQGSAAALGSRLNSGVIMKGAQQYAWYDYRAYVPCQ